MDELQGHQHPAGHGNEHVKQRGEKIPDHQPLFDQIVVERKIASFD